MEAFFVYRAACERCRSFHQLQLPPAPGDDLNEALNNLAGSEVIRDALQEHICRWFLEVKNQKNRNNEMTVHQWETDS